MHEWWSVELMRERNAWLLAEADERRLARLARQKTVWTALRTWAARRLFDFAMALEREEIWRAVWERLEAPRHP